MKSHFPIYLKRLQEYFLIKKSGLFDVKYYFQTYTEIEKLKINPILHYIKNGWHEGKNPSPNFDTVYYLRENKDIRKARINPLVHFIQFGQAEGRAPNPTLSTDPYNYKAWIDQYDTLTLSDRILIESHIETFSHKPLISILLPVYNTHEQFLQETLDSLLAQYYPNWECCIVDDASSKTNIRTILEVYAKKDPRFKVVYRETNGHISAASNTALSTASGEYIGLLDHDDVLREHALYMVVNEINNFPDAEIIYSDEDLIDEFSVRYDPYFKPDWNPELFCGHNLISHFGVYKADRTRQIGGFREGYEGAQDWDLAMRISEILPASSIRHVPFILYHCRAVIGSSTPPSSYNTYAKEAQLRTVVSHFDRINRPVEIIFVEDEFWRVKHCVEDPKPLVSIIIPTRNQVGHLRKCLDSIRNHTQYSNYELIIINNQSDDDETLEYLNEIQKENLITLLEYNHPFNYSAINNFAAQQAKGEVLVFLNNDIEVISPDWLDEMIGLAIKPEIGAVGAMLYYPNDTIQHAGIILGMKGIAGHSYYGSPRGTIGQRGRVRLTQNLSAVTGACMAVSKEKFLSIDGFNETQLGIAYNDIDLCIRLMKAGYRNVWTPHAELYHYESLTREYENTPKKLARFKSEADYLINQWAGIIANDPAYNPNLSISSPDFSLAFPPRVIKPWIHE